MVNLVRTGTESGVEVWTDPGGSCVEYRAPDGPVLRCEAFHGRRHVLQERMGARITTRDSRFERADIHSFYFVPGHGLRRDSDHAGDGTSLDEYYGRLIGVSDFPERVESRCRVQWHGTRFTSTVVLGAPRWPVGELDFSSGYPDDWPPPGRLVVTPTRLAFHVRGQGTASQRIHVRNWAAASQTVRVHEPTNPQFNAPVGRRSIAGGASADLVVRFRTHGSRTSSGTMDIDTPTGRVRVGLTGYSEPDNR